MNKTKPIQWEDYPELIKPHGEKMMGSLKTLKGLWSPQLQNRRDVLVYLPPSYAYGTWRYPVIYMHDGQNLFDPATSFAGAWHVDETIGALSQEGLEAIVVGILHMGEQRIVEYSPFADRKLGGGQGEAYLTFVIETIKPVIDQTWRTLPERAYTGMIGSSMGGLISLYAYFRFPEVFGFAGALSPSLWFAEPAIFSFIEQTPFRPGKLYLDMGGREFLPENRRATTNRPVPRDGGLQQMCSLLRRKGYRSGQDLLCILEKGAAHREAAWARRLPHALRFLLGV